MYVWVCVYVCGCISDSMCVSVCVREYNFLCCRKGLCVKERKKRLNVNILVFCVCLCVCV